MEHQVPEDLKEKRENVDLLENLDPLDPLDLLVNLQAMMQQLCLPYLDKETLRVQIPSVLMNP